MKKNRYSQDLYKKHGSDPAVWVLLEIMSFGALTKFIEFYATKYPSKQLKTFINGRLQELTEHHMLQNNLSW